MKAIPKNICFRKPNDLGALPNCPSGYERDGANCVGDCPSGYKLLSGACWTNCAEGFKDTGTLCVNRRRPFDHPETKKSIPVKQLTM